MGENSSVEELLVQGHAKVAGNGAQVVVGDGLPDDAAAHGEHLDVNFRALFDGVGQTEGCLLYTSAAADEGLGVYLGGRRIIKKK